MAKKSGSEIGNDKKRSAKIVSFIFVFILAGIALAWIISAFSKSEQTNDTKMSKIAGQQVVNTAENKQYTEQMAKYNARKADEAARQGSSWMSIPDYYEIDLEKPQETKPVPPARQSASRPQLKPVAVRQPGMKPAGEARKEAQELLAQLSASWVYAVPADAPERTIPGYAQTIMPSVTSSPALNAAAPTVVPAVAPYRLYEALKVCPARSLVKLDTNTNSMVRATLMCKELANATIYAPGYKLVGEDIDMTFSLMTFNKKTYKIQAKPIDLDTGRSMLTADINHNYVRRILIPSLARATEKVGSLYENSTDNTTYVSNGTVVSSSSGKVDMDQVRGTFIGGIAEQTAKVIEADNARIPPIQGTRNESTFGVTFLTPVMSTDVVEKGDTAVSIPQQPAAQEQMNSQNQYLHDANIPAMQPGDSPLFRTGSVSIN